jgi:hypothetical protein
MGLCTVVIDQINADPLIIERADDMATLHFCQVRTFGDAPTLRKSLHVVVPHARTHRCAFTSPSHQ